MRAARIDALADRVADTWPAAKPTTPEELVALFVVAHRELYGGVSCAPELAGRSWAYAVRDAEDLAKRLGGYERACDFIEWVWRRERRNPNAHARLSWRRATSDGLIAAWKGRRTQWRSETR